MNVLYIPLPFFFTRNPGAALPLIALQYHEVKINVLWNEAQFIAGKGMPNDQLQANISGAVSGALHIHNIAKYYGVPVVLHTDHASKKWLPWISALVDAGEQFKKEKGQPLFSSHMLDLSEEPLEENIETSAQFYKRMAPLGMGIEIELGVTGGEEDGVDNSDVENDKLYTQPQHVAGSVRGDRSSRN